MPNLIAATPYYNDGDWAIYLGLALLLGWVAWGNWKDRRAEDTEPFEYGFWDERPALTLVEPEPTKPYLYDWEKEDWGL